MTEIEIHIRPSPAGKNAYPIEAELSDESYFSGHFRLDITTLQDFQQHKDVQSYGSILFYTLFNGAIRQAYDKAVTLAESTPDGRLRVKLWIDPEAVELHHLRWGALYHKPGRLEVPLTIDEKTPFSRYLGLGMAESQPVAERPLKVLFAVSNPSDLEEKNSAPILVENEIRNFLMANEEIDWRLAYGPRR